MSFGKSVQKIVLLAALMISAFLLCFIGVYSVTSLNLNFVGVVDTSILCKIDVNDGNKSTTIFNNFSGTASSYISSQNNLKNFTSEVTGDVATNLTFTLTNYTANKNIRLSVQSATLAGNAINQDFGSAVCNIGSDAGVVNNAPLVVSVTPANANSQILNISFIVEEVYEVVLQGTSLATAGSYYFGALDGTFEMPLAPVVGWQLPQAVAYTTNAQPTLTRSSNLEGQVSLNVAGLEKVNGKTITANCQQVFQIKKNGATALGNTIVDGTTYLPNNGAYSVEGTTVTKESGFKEYPYYVELGEYPQAKVEDQATITALDSLGQNYEKTYTQNINNNAVPQDVSWYKYQGNYYVKTYAHYYGHNNAESDAEWFKVEPIIWLILEATDTSGAEISLDSLVFDEDKSVFYVDALKGQLFAGKLLLMSAFVLDASAFDDDKTTTSTHYANSDVDAFMNSGAFSQAQALSAESNLLQLRATNSAGNYISSTELNTYVRDESVYSVSGQIKTPSNMFLLASKNVTITNDADKKDYSENYVMQDYFENGAPEREQGAFTSTIAVTSPTDYALAHYTAENEDYNVNIPESDDNEYKPILGFKRGWGISGKTLKTTSCAYWSRSAHKPSDTQAYSMAAIVNMNGFYINTSSDNNTYGTKASDTNIGVRPCFILDLGFYKTGVFTPAQTTPST